MVKLVKDGEDLRGKVIKYCNICHGVDGNEYNILATEDEYLMMYNVDYDNGIIKCYNEQSFKTAVLVWQCLRNELLPEEIITNDEILEWKKERDNNLKERDKKIKQRRYEEYLKLKQEFEGEK